MRDLEQRTPAHAAGSRGTGAGLGRAWLGLLTLTLSSFAAVTTEMLPVGLLPRIGDAFDVTESVAGLLVSLYAVMVAVLAVPLTIATRRLPRKALLLGSLASYTLSNLLVAVAPGFAVVAVGRALGGITHALFFSVCIGYATRLVAAEHTGRALAIASAGVSAGFVLGVPVGVSLGTSLGWRSAFVAMTACTALAFVLAAVVLPGVPTASGAAETRPGRTRRLVTVIASNTLAYMGHYTLFTYVSVLLLRSGAAPTGVGPLLLVFGAVGLGTLAVAARHLDVRPRASGLVIVGLIAAGIIGVGLGYPALGAVVVAGIAWNAGFGPVSSLYQASAVRARATSPDLAGAWINATCNFGIAAGAAVGGGVLDAAGLAAVAWVAAGLVVLALLIVLLAPRAFAAQG
ncbi:MFS transporter [Goodfellowiella coeruleoviolacea]|uniref:Arabinose efflux permease, MFS family n=1 Tax=Goodfellowiella coeruleoviolacea TaxID=334858 RepID=A0AAE3KHH7_9PSEU|nr:MFS transporter [Goodfellowiella coeruleoviolacea]MCP2167345.1 putative arabinose efflux permease, MFS family [Goodfellowiella coeruleoviolacea]